MTDNLTPEQRRKAMQHIHAKETSIEIKLRKALWKEGVRYRKNVKGLPGTPDIVITKWKIAVFCDGSFWHGRNFNNRNPNMNHKKYWEAKILGNIKRDKDASRLLYEMGWTVLRFWDVDINKHLNECVNGVQQAIEKAKRQQSS